MHPEKYFTYLQAANHYNLFEEKSSYSSQQRPRSGACPKSKVKKEKNYKAWQAKHN